RPERVRELLAVSVQQHCPVSARRLRDRVALHVRGPGAAVRVVLQRIEVARLRAEPARDLGHLARGVGMVGRELADALRLGVAASARGEDGRRRLDGAVADARTPAALSLLEVAERRVREALSRACLPRLAQALGDRMAGAVADLQ